ncbi:MAG: type II secretion system protein GspG [Kiritimatiellia bacterium]
MSSAINNNMVVFKNHASGKRGLTLIEMLTVLFVVSILVAFVVGTARYSSRAAEVRRAEADLHLLADALERYYLRFGEYPPDEPDNNYPATALLARTQPIPGTPGEYYVFSNSLPRDFTALDPWGESYRYVRHASSHDDISKGIDTFTLYSLGPDRNSPDDNIRL